MHTSEHVQVLISVLRRPFDEVESEPLDLSRSPEDGLLEAARLHGVVGMAYRSLCGIPSAPSSLVDAFRTASHTEAAWGCILAAEAAGIFGILQRQGIDALALKGPALSVLAFGNPATRSCCDLDILVSPRDVPAAVAALSLEGYVEEDLPPGQRGAEGRKDLCLIHPATGTTLELHWSLHLPHMRAQMDREAIWRRRQTVELSGREIATLGPEDTFLYLCIHGAVHHWSQLKWVCDIAYLLELPSGHTWESVLEEATEMGCRRMLLVGAGLAAQLFGARVPPVFEAAWSKDRVAQSLTRNAAADLLATGTRRRDVTGLAHPIDYRERAGDRLLLLKNKLKNKWRPNVADIEAVPLPRAFHTLYFLIRPVRLLRTYGLGWLKSVLTGS